MKYIIGRNNFALTIFIPQDCNNNCPFCTSKENYEKQPASLQAVADAANYILDKVSPAVLAAHFNRYEAVSTVYELTELSDLKSFIMECVVTPVTVYSYGAD